MCLTQFVEHCLRDEAYPVFAAAEALGIHFRILADDEPFGDYHAMVYHDIGEARMTADLHLGQDDRTFETGI